ncbi:MULTISPECIES: helix-turn-helix transcriptional regulator [unclassified Sphingomonas]|nr:MULTISPECIES: helix-turn-helix transcriptional regulator [unclassified Sphingomonas]
MELTVTQCRAARALLNWTKGGLAQAAGVGVMTVNRFERGSNISAASISALTEALADAGVSFIASDEPSPAGGEGVRLARVRSPASSSD